MTSAHFTRPKAFAFDLFGTVVDWRTTVVQETTAFLVRIGKPDIDPSAFADAWRMRYFSRIAAFGASGRTFIPLDVIHRELLDETLQAEGVELATIDEGLLEDWNKVWHRLAPWPDSVAGLARLKAGFPIVALSNGNVAMVLAMARRAKLPWDAILGAEFARAYKPDPRAYLETAKALAIAPGELCLVAAHHSDLAAARSCGLLTAYVHRPLEYGGAPAPDLHVAQVWDWSVSSLVDLAAEFGC